MTQTVTWRAAAPTSHASRYLQQLCKHWSHRFEVQFDPTAGRIDLGDGVICVLGATQARLDVELTAPADNADRMKDVVEKHLRRFAHREPDMAFVWTPSGS